ncbi:MAG: protein kinase [Candidatus Zixiibacteriota bacterium]|nr:MAG: protein kinase [candidate division Zixibacteria bacterium]
MKDDSRQDDNTHTHAVMTKGTMVAHYRLAERIGAGGMGEVYLAQDTELDRNVALKFLSTQLCQDEECRARFKREAQAAAKLDHPNIVTVYEVGEYQGRPFFAMQHVEGRSLRDIILEKKISQPQAVDYAIQLCEGLNEAHAAGVVHRDVKPGNIIIDTKGRPRLLDFGLATVLGTDQITKAGSTLGTHGYMSPEQLQGGEVDHRADIFSLGVVLFEMMTSEKPFQGDNEAAVSHAIVYDMPPVLTEYAADIPAGLQSVVDKMLEKNVADRYESVVDLLHDLGNVRKQMESDNPSSSSRPSIAVLPFTNLSADPEQEYFCDGMAEEIINALTHIEELRVVARTSCFAFKGRQADIREIGRKLNVETLLEGSVRKAGKRIRVTAQLVKVSDGYHLWSERYDRELEDVFTIQDEISLAIVEKLKVKLLEKDRVALTRRPTINPEAHSLYLKGRYFWSKRSREGFEKAIEYYKLAVGIDPSYSQAHAGIAACYNDLPNYSTFPPSQAYPLAKEAALKALELDDENAEARTALGLIKSDYEWDWEGAEKEFRRAIELNPAYETAHHWYAFLLIYQEKVEEAMAEMHRAHDLDPLSLATNRNLGFLYYLARRYDDALEWLHKAVELDPEFTYTHFVMGLTYLRKRDFDKAIEALQRERNLTGGVNPIVVLPLGIAYMRMGDREKAEEILAGVEERMHHEYISPFYLAQLYFALGRIDTGFELVQKAYDERDIHMRTLKVMPMEKEVRQDARYATFLKKMKLD